MFDLEANTYSATSQLIADAIEHSRSHDETVTIRANAARYQGIRESLLAACEGYGDGDLFWGDDWQIRLLGRDTQAVGAMTRYAVYRDGANAANQGTQLRCLVAVVEAPNAAAACETRASNPGTLYATSELVHAPGVHAYHNQHFWAKPASRASKADLARLEEDES